MGRVHIALAVLAIIAPPVTSTAFAQGSPQTMALSQVDLSTLATGYRTSKVVGSKVFNSAGENVGTIDDLIVTPNDKIPFAVLSVGGFLGMGSKYVVVSYAALSVVDKKIILNDATKQSLRDLPEYKYTH